MSLPGRSMDELAGSLSSLARRAAGEYAQLVESIIGDPSPEVGEIERTLDGLLGFCFDPRVLGLYRKLCGRNLSIDPEATCEYIRAYREMWDPEEDAPPRPDAPAGHDDGE